VSDSGACEVKDEAVGAKRSEKNTFKLTFPHAKAVQKRTFLHGHGVVRRFKYFDANLVLRGCENSCNTQQKMNKRTHRTLGLNESWHIVAVAKVPRPSTRTNSQRPLRSCGMRKLVQLGAFGKHRNLGGTKAMHGGASS
jgi:hypothetical protein